jgi:hypothetical protein
VKAIVKQPLESPRELGIFDVAPIQGNPVLRRQDVGYFRPNDHLDGIAFLVRLKIKERMLVPRKLFPNAFDRAHCALSFLTTIVRIHPKSASVPATAKIAIVHRSTPTTV